MNSLINSIAFVFCLSSSTFTTVSAEFLEFHPCIISKDDLSVLVCVTELYQNSVSGSYSSQFVSVLLRYILIIYLMVWMVCSAWLSVSRCLATFICRVVPVSFHSVF
jgi:hypothetical protein